MGTCTDHDTQVVAKGLRGVVVVVFPLQSFLVVPTFVVYKKGKHRTSENRGVARHLTRLKSARIVGFNAHFHKNDDGAS